MPPRIVLSTPTRSPLCQAHTHQKTTRDQVAAPEAYYFLGPVSWTIRTYSKFLRLPATYSSQGSNFTRPGGSMSEGTTG